LQTVLARVPDPTSAYYSGAVDGDFGLATDAAVRSYQSDRALAADGIVGERTWLSAVSLPGETLDVAAGVAT
jgi:peptidoglycan hydrolase-like protein with peptidoglycan-binding domain